MSNYNVGYKKPPTNYQFKPGKSGNPKGKPKGKKDFKTDLMEELSEKIQITEDGKTKKISKQKALVKSLTAKAIKGNERAANIIITAIYRLMETDTDEAFDDPSASDLEIIDRFKARLMKEIATKEEEGKDG